MALWAWRQSQHGPSGGIAVSGGWTRVITDRGCAQRRTRSKGVGSRVLARHCCRAVTAWWVVDEATAGDLPPGRAVQGASLALWDDTERASDAPWLERGSPGAGCGIGQPIIVESVDAPWRRCEPCAPALCARTKTDRDRASSPRLACAGRSGECGAAQGAQRCVRMSAGAVCDDDRNVQ